MDDAARQRHSLSRIRGLKRGDAFFERSASSGFLDDHFGRLTEMTAPSASAVLTAAMDLVRDAQRQGEPVVWITSLDSAFFPPDAKERGVDLNALTVVRVKAESMIAAADKTARSGGFGLIVTDLSAAEPQSRIASEDAVLSRLLGLAKKHDIAVVFLTRKESGLSLGSLISLRKEAGRSRTAADCHEVTVCTVKDKRRPPGRRIQEQCRGPSGMC